MIMAMPTVADHVTYGRNLVGSGQLVRLRHRIGLTRSAMANLLHMSPITYKRMEEDQTIHSRMWESTAERVGRFAYLAETTLDDLREENVPLDDLSPLHVIATNHGLPQELMLQWFRAGKLPAYDLGILGLWIHKDDVHYLRENL